MVSFWMFGSVLNSPVTPLEEIELFLLILTCLGRIWLLEVDRSKSLCSLGILLFLTNSHFTRRHLEYHASFQAFLSDIAILLHQGVSFDYESSKC